MGRNVIDWKVVFGGFLVVFKNVYTGAVKSSINFDVDYDSVKNLPDLKNATTKLKYKCSKCKAKWGNNEKLLDIINRIRGSSS
jgi:hypothetical protein